MRTVQGALVTADTHHRARPVAGVPHSAGEVDLAAIVAAKDELIGALRQAKYVDLVADYGFQLRHRDGDVGTTRHHAAPQNRRRHGTKPRTNVV